MLAGVLAARLEVEALLAGVRALRLLRLAFGAPGPFLALGLTLATAPAATATASTSTRSVVFAPLGLGPTLLGSWHRSTFLAARRRRGHGARSWRSRRRCLGRSGRRGLHRCRS
jgi:hypothetical protein